METLRPDDKFNVVQFFENGTTEYVRRAVTAEEAMKAAQHYCSSVAARIGVVTEVMITDMGDCCCFHWKKAEGVVHPKVQP